MGEKTLSQSALKIIKKLPARDPVTRVSVHIRTTSLVRSSDTHFRIFFVFRTNEMSTLTELYRKLTINCGID